MTLSELIQELEYIQGELNPDEDPEVRIAEQPSWPFEYRLAGVVLFDPAFAETDSGEVSEGERVVFLAEGSQLQYLRPGASEEVWG